MGHLIVAADAPFWIRAAADTVLFAHIGGGTVGMVSGTVAIAARKGGRVHRAAGNIFFAGMMALSVVGFVVAPMLNDRVSTIAGLLTFYLVVTAWLTARRPPGTLSRWEVAAALIPLAALAMGATFIHMASLSPDGMVDGQPPQANYMFSIVGAFALAGDAHLILRRGLTGAARITRHLWRMCVSLFIATGSFFLGQQQMLPKSWHGSPALFLPVLAPLLLMLFWLAHTWWKARPRRPRTAVAA